MTTLSPPVSPMKNEGRPRLSTSASYLSNRSRRSSTSFGKIDLVEHTKDKKRLNTKADPSVALKEAQPMAIALEASTLEDVRAIQHRDFEGNIITDPDRTNPTRHRLERPLDTIRGFQAAADGTTNRRSSYQSRPSAPGYAYNGQENRRSSHYGNGGFSPPPRTRPGAGAGGYYRNSSYGVNSFAEESAPAQPPYGRPPRPQGQPQYGYAEGSSPANSYQQTYDAMTSGSDEYNKSTNPSSQNSSFDHLHQMHARKPDENGHYDEIQPVQPPNHGYGQYPQYPQHGGQPGNYNRPPQRSGPPPPPQQNSARQPIQLTTSSSGPPPTRADLNKDLPQKRQSWIKRKLSRRDS